MYKDFLHYIRNKLMSVLSSYPNVIQSNIVQYLTKLDRAH